MAKRQCALPQASECKNLREVTYDLHGDAVLEVRIYTTKGKLLALVMTCLLEGVVMELPAIAVGMLGSHAVHGGVLFKVIFGSKCHHR
jgi:hypothetical protein